jgi:colicin import membrane protein
MIRQRENPVMWQAGALSLLVHGAFFLMLVMTFSWKSIAPMQVAQVELWDSLPVTKVVPPAPPKPAPVIEPKPEPKPEPAPEPKADIQMKPKPPAKPKVEPKPVIKPDPKLQAKKEEDKRLEDLKRAMLEDDNPALEQKHEAQQLAAAKNAQTQSQAQAGVQGAALDAAKAAIIAKIKRNVNRQVCGNGKPVLEFAIALMPTGEVSGAPRLLKTSGITACDQAVERAILQSQPLPIPRDAELFAQLRDLNLKFRPNDDN